jgi:hypothetical protein
MDKSEKARENRLRRSAARQNLKLTRVRRRDPNAWDYGTYQLIEASLELDIAEGLTLDEVEDWIAQAVNNPYWKRLQRERLRDSADPATVMRRIVEEQNRRS